MEKHRLYRAIVTLPGIDNKKAPGKPVLFSSEDWQI